MVKIEAASLNFLGFLSFQMAYILMVYSKPFVKRPLSKRPNICFQDQVSLNAGQKYCRMLPLEHSAIILTFIKLPNVNKIFVLSLYCCFIVAPITYRHNIQTSLSVFTVFFCTYIIFVSLK